MEISRDIVEVVCETLHHVGSSRSVLVRVDRHNFTGRLGLVDGWEEFVRADGSIGIACPSCCPPKVEST